MAGFEVITEGVAEEIKTNNSDSVEKVYVIATTIVKAQLRACLLVDLMDSLRGRMIAPFIHLLL